MTMDRLFAFLGIDTSNYTTSAALYCPGTAELTQQKKPLPVAVGERGLRQSDALFHHTVQLPALVRELFSHSLPPHALGVSARPRDLPGSYMPCFLAGVSAAECAAAALGVPLYHFSHQAGHLAAVLLGTEKTELRFAPFLAFHISGGTTDLLHVTPNPHTIFTVERIGGSSDLHAGQVIDRIGVRMGLPFPCGAQMDLLAGESTRQFQPKLSIKGLDCSLSGLENQCIKMQESGESTVDISRFCFESLLFAFTALAENARAQHGALPLVFSGGVAASAFLRMALEARFQAVFAPPAYSADNAAGIAAMTFWKEDAR